VQLNYAQRELTVKVVYYGPGLSGKTTNLQQIYDRTPAEVRGRLLTLDTQDDRTLFFDLLPIFFQTDNGCRVKIKLFTVPGQVLHNATRRLVLQDADAVVFVADSRRTAAEDNNAYWRNLHDNMVENGLDPAQIPIVIQFNKQDLPDARTGEELEESRSRGKEPVLGAIAVRGEGVLETLHAVLREAYRSLETRLELERKVGLTEAQFLERVFSRWDLRGTKLEGQFS